MIKPVHIFLLLFNFSAFADGRRVQKQDNTIILKDEALPFTPKEFYAERVADERADKTPFAKLVPALAVGGNDLKFYVTDLSGGTFTALKLFIGHNLPHNNALRPVIISLKKFIVTENVVKGRIEGHAILALSFSLDRGSDEEPLHLADYNGNTVYTRSAGAAQEIEPALRSLLENGLSYLNSWMDQHAAGDIKLARQVKISFINYAEKNEGDTIYYSVGRPLTWDDFRSKANNGKYDAEVFPSIGYNEHVTVAKGVINIELALKTFVPKSACWVRDGRRDDYNLNHEQRHFDIAKITAEHFKQHLKTETLPVGNFDGPVNVDYLDAFREMNYLQKQYDGETRHGGDQAAQQRWNERIDKELRELGVK